MRAQAGGCDGQPSSLSVVRGKRTKRAGDKEGWVEPKKRENGSRTDQASTQIGREQGRGKSSE